MLYIEKTLRHIVAVQKKIEALDIDVGFGEYWRVEVKVPEYWAVQKDLEAITRGTPSEKISEAFTADMKNLAEKHTMDKVTLARMRKNLIAIIAWLKALKEQEAA